MRQSKVFKTRNGNLYADLHYFLLKDSFVNRKEVIPPMKDVKKNLVVILGLAIELLKVVVWFISKQ